MLGKLFTRDMARQGEARAAGSGFEIVIDGVQVGNPMQTYRGAMSIPGAWRAALLISNLLGRMPWDAYRQRGDAPVELLDPRPPLLEQPCGQETRMATFSSWALDLLWHGNSVAVVAERNSEGYPTAVYPVPADSVGVRRLNGSDYSPLPTGELEYSIGGRVFTAYEVIHIKGPCQPGAVRGFGVLEAHLAGALNLARDLQDQAETISRHGVPTGALKSQDPDLNQEQADELKAKWLAAQQKRSIAVLNATTEFQPIAWNPEELQLVEARKFSLHEIALIFGLPLYFLGADQASRTYSNVESESLNLLKYTLGGHLARFEQTLSAHFPRGTTVKANLDSILRADTLNRYQAHQIGIQAGFLTRDEARHLEDRPPLTPAQRDELLPKPPPAPVPEPAPAGPDDIEETDS